MTDSFGVSRETIAKGKKVPTHALLHGLTGKTPVRVLGPHTKKDYFWVLHKEERTLAHRSRLTFIKPPKDMGISKAHHHHYTLRRVIKELASQGATTTYDRSKRSRVRKYLKETPEGWIVVSHKGKPLSKPASREQAAKRLRQIEYFKRQG